MRQWNVWAFAEAKFDRFFPLFFVKSKFAVFLGTTTFPKLRGPCQNWGAGLWDQANWSSFIKGAANSQRSALSFAGKCRLVRRGVQWAAGEAWKWWKYTNTPQIRIRIHRERQEIHKYKNTNTHKYKYYYWQSEPDQKRKKMRFSEKVFAQRWL